MAKHPNKGWRHTHDPKTARVFQLVEASGISLAEVSRRSGLSKTHLLRMKNGEVRNSFNRTLDFILDAIGVKVLMSIQTQGGSSNVAKAVRNQHRKQASFRPSRNRR